MIHPHEDTTGAAASTAAPSTAPTSTAAHSAAAHPTAPSRKPHTLGDVVASYPVGTLVASAAVGVGLMALLSAVTHRVPARRNAAASLPTTTPTTAPSTPKASYADLQLQLTQLVRNMAAMLPTAAQARQTVGETAHRVAQGVGGTATRGWGHLADEAEQVVRGLAPGVQTAGQAAREHPVMTALAAGALGALATSWALGQQPAAGAHAAAPSAAETPPPM